MKDNLKKHILGRDGFIWWIGQIAKQTTWEKNKPPSPVDSNEDEEYKGFGERYRVRIQGYHPTIDCDAVPDDALPWAYVMYPPTAGGGGRASYQSCNLTQGNFVFGWFIDGEDAQIPVIMGVLGYNDYQAVAKQTEGCTNQTPVSGFDQEQENNEVSPFSVRESGGGTVETQENAKGQPNNDLIIESAQGNNSLKDMASKENNETGKVEEPLAKNEDCEPLPTARIQKEMQNLMTEMEKVQRSVTDLRSAISMGSGDIEGKISGLQAKATQFIAAQLKSIFTQVEKSVIKQLNDGVKPTYNQLHPNEQPELKEKVEEANDQIACLFKKLIDQLTDMVGDMLGDLFGDGSDGSGQKVVNVPDCYVNGMVGSIIGSQMNQINNDINDIFGQVDSILSSVGSAADAAGGLGGGIGGLGDFGGMNMDVVEDLFSFLQCEEENQCPQVDTWSTWYGGEKGNKGDMSSITSAASNFASGGGSGSSGGGGGSLSGGSFVDLDFDRVRTNNSCDGSRNQTTDPIPCGPPVAFINDGHGVDINLVISSSGKVISTDVVTYGVNYTKNGSSIRVYDYCGLGHGAQVTPVLAEVQVCDNGDGTLNLDYNGDITTIFGAKMSSGKLGYYDDKGELQPIYDKDGNTIPDCGMSMSIVDAIVTAPGLDYLPSPDGSQGGSNRVWSRPDDTIIRNPDGSWQPPTPPGVTVPVDPGETVITPPTSPPIITEPLPGIPGSGTTPTPPGTTPPPPGTTPDQDEETPEGDLIMPGVRTEITVPARITTPSSQFPARPQNIYPSDGDGSYPVILYLCEIIIQNSGFNYSLGDEIVITPDHGARATAKFDQTGRVVSVKVDSGGEGFTEIPRIYVKSQTGYNAKFTPKFCIDRISNDKVKEPDYQDKIITVIDCVGKVT